MQVMLFLGGRSKMHARVVVGMEKGVMFREVSSYKGSGIDCIFGCSRGDHPYSLFPLATIEKLRSSTKGGSSSGSAGKTKGHTAHQDPPKKVG